MFYVVDILDTFGKKCNCLYASYTLDYKRYTKYYLIGSGDFFVSVFDDEDCITEQVSGEQLGYYLSLGVNIVGISKRRNNRTNGFDVTIKVTLPDYSEYISLEKRESFFNKTKKFNPYLLKEYGCNKFVDNIIFSNNLYYIRDGVLYNTSYKKLERQKKLFGDNLLILEGYLFVLDIGYTGELKKSFVYGDDPLNKLPPIDTISDLIRFYSSSSQYYVGVHFDYNIGRLVIDTLTDRYTYKVDQYVIKHMMKVKMSGVLKY